MIKENTSIRLKKIMHERGLRQIDILNKAKPFCEKYNIKLGRNDISQYVSGKVEPSQRKLSILAKALDVSETWLMGYDEFNESETLLTNTVLYNFLKDIKFDDIDEKVKNDKNRIIISYIDFYDIIIMIYSNKFNLARKLKDFDYQYIKMLESFINEIKETQHGNKKTKISDNINLLDLEDTLFFVKKNKLYYSIKKYYSETDILREIDKRNLFDITDNNGIYVQEENKRFASIKLYIDHTLKNIEKKN